MTWAVHVADVWVNRQSLGSSGESVDPPLNAEAMQLLGLQEDELEEIWAPAADEITDIVNQFLKH